MNPSGLALMASLVLMLGACGDSDDSPTTATLDPTASGTFLAILTPVSGSAVKGNVVFSRSRGQGHDQDRRCGRQLRGHRRGSADIDLRASLLFLLTMLLVYAFSRSGTGMTG